VRVIHARPRSEDPRPSTHAGDRGRRVGLDVQRSISRAGSGEHTLRMTGLASRTNATLPRLSHVVRRLEERGLVARFACPDDARATNVRLTSAGWDKVRETAPGHVANVRAHVIDALTPEQVGQMSAIGDAILSRVAPDGKMTAHRRL